MCGIAGFVVADAAEGGAPHRARVLDRMCRRIAHRGPDDQGVERFGRCVLGYRRLAILDLAPTGRQPVSNESAGVHAVLNGRRAHKRPAQTTSLAVTGASSNTTVPLWDWQGCTAMPLGVGHSLDVRQWVCEEEGRSDLVGGFV